MSNKWEEWLFFGGPMPHIQTEEVEPPEGFFTCVVCGVVNDYWHITCEKHDDGRSEEGEDD